MDAHKLTLIRLASWCLFEGKFSSRLDSLESFSILKLFTPTSFLFSSMRNFLVYIVDKVKSTL